MGIWRSLPFTSEFLNETKPKTKHTNKQKKRDMTRKAAVPLNAPFHNAVLYFASLGLPLGKKINKIHSAIHFLFSPIVLKQLPQMSW